MTSLKCVGGAAWRCARKIHRKVYACVQTASHFQGTSICLLASTATVAMDGFARTTLWTNQMGYNIITLVAQLPCIYGHVNQPCPWATPSDSVGLLP